MPYQNARLAQWCVLLTWAYVGTTAFWALDAALFLNFDREVIFADLDISDGIGGAVELVTGAGLLILVIGALATFVLNGTWLYRASANAQARDPDPQRISPRMAVIWFAVPIANLFMPFQGIKQIWNTTVVGRGPLTSPAPGFFALWWAGWIISDVMANISFRLSMSDDWDDYTASMWLDLLSAPLTILSAVLFIRIIRKVTVAENAAVSTAEIFD
ncbi:MAG: DUF4328 domain-containing protein [Pseudomonadota bacterium]